MKVMILGPIISNSYVGGVAIFDEGLASGFKALGHEVIIGTHQKIDPSITFARHINAWNIRKVVRDEKPDCIIASLQYGVYFSKLKHQPNKALFLHGYFNIRNYGAVKTWLAITLQKYMAKHSHYVFANSHLTKLINSFIWNIKVDKALPIGTSVEYLKTVVENKVIRNCHNRRIVYVGRLEKSKQVDTLIKAVRQLHDSGIECRLDIIGAGSQESYLKELATEDKDICFLGRLSHDALYKQYTTAEVFVSLCDGESFGITFAEALLAGCKIVCPQTGGQVEFLSRYPDRTRMVNGQEVSEVVAAIQNLFATSVQDIDAEKIVRSFSYEVAAQSIIELFERRC